jgi:hypothetical protein
MTDRLPAVDVVGPAQCSKSVFVFAVEGDSTLLRDPA